MANFLWGSAGQKMSPAQVAEQRKIAQALIAEGSDTSPVGHWTAALNRGLQGYLGGRQAYQAREAEAAGRAGYEAKRAGMSNAATFGGADPVAAALSGGAGLGNYEVPAGGEAIREGLIARGLPEHVADGFMMNFQDESGLNPGINERNPIVPGSRGGFGLYQLTGPRRTAYEQFAGQRGVDPSDVDAQLDWLMYELQGPEAKAAQSIFSTGNAGEAGAAIVNNFLRPAAEHRQTRASRYLGGASVPAQNNMASIAALLSDEWVPESERAVLQAQMQQAQAMEMADYEQQRRQADPMYQAQLEGALLANQAARQPQAPKPIEVGGVLLDPTTYQPIFDSREKKAGYTQLSPDQAAQFGLDPSRQWQVSGDNKIEPIGGTPLVQNNLGGEKQWDQESAKLWAKRYDGMVGGASNARDMLAMYDLAESAINSGVRTGFGASQEQALRKMAAGLGIGAEDAEKLAGGELLNTVQNRMALMMRNPDGGMGMPGAMSDADRKFLSDSQVGLDRTPEGNRKMLAAFRAMEQRKIEISELADQYITENGMLDQGFNRVVKDYAEANPMFKVDPDSQGGTRITSKEEFDALPSGTVFIAPDGSKRRKP